MAKHRDGLGWCISFKYLLKIYCGGGKLHPSASQRHLRLSGVEGAEKRNRGIPNIGTTAL